MATVPDVQARLHGGDADGACRGEAAESAERLAAEHYLAFSLMHQGRAVEAEPMLRRLHEVMMRVHGAEDPSALTAASNLAMCLLNQGK